MNRQKKRGLHSSTSSEVSPNTRLSYTSKSPRRSVSIRAFTLDSFFNFAEFPKQESKRTLFVFMS